MPSDAHAGSRRKRLFAAYIRSACPGRQAQEIRTQDAPLCSVWRKVRDHSQQNIYPCANFIFIYAFPTVAFIRLIRFALQTCAPCAFENAQACNPTPSAKTKEAHKRASFVLAEGEGFEPPEALQLQRFSRPPLSTAQPTFPVCFSRFP